MSVYWIGPYGIKVPIDFTHVPAADGGNIYYRDGKQTERGVPRHLALSPAQYMGKYGVNRGTAEKQDWWYSDTHLQCTNPDRMDLDRVQSSHTFTK